jgi:hypothetical protein
MRMQRWRLPCTAPPPHHGVTTVPLCRSRERTAVVQATATTLKKRIEYGELIGSGVLERALNVQCQALSAAMKAGRLFAFVGPSGENLLLCVLCGPDAGPAHCRKNIESARWIAGYIQILFFHRAIYRPSRHTPWRLAQRQRRRSAGRCCQRRGPVGMPGTLPLRLPPVDIDQRVLDIVPVSPKH